jgi:hypothetical protein
MCTRPSSQLALATLVGQQESARVHSFGAGESHSIRVGRSCIDGSLCATGDQSYSCISGLAATSERKLRISETIGQTSSSLVWGQTEIVYAWNVVAMTGAFVQPGISLQLYLWPSSDKRA